MNHSAPFLFLILLCLNCNSSKTSGNQHPPQNLTEKTDVQYDTLKNETGAYILYIQRINNTSLERINFFVIDVKTNRKLVEKNIRPGYVKWIELDVIEYLDVPGMVAEDEDLSAYTKKLNINEIKP